MSHLYNLLHKPSGHPHKPLEPAVAAVSEPEGITPSLLISFANAAPSNTTLSDCPVEEACITPANHLVYYDDPRSPAAERFRLLRMRLREFWTAGKLKKLLVTSPLAHTGKSTVVMNLATALAERGKYTVLVVEADLHHSSIAKTLRLKPWTGLTECLVDDAAPAHSSIRRIEPLGWYLLAAGEPDGRNPTELLQGPALAQVMGALAPSFDWILVDSPPVLPLTDSLSLQRQTDATLLVVRSGETPREAVEQSVAMLGKQNILGIVLNAVEAEDRNYYGYYNDTRRHSRD